MNILAAASLLALAQTAPAPDAWREYPSARGAILAFGAPDDALISLRCLRPGLLRATIAGLYTGDGPEPRSVAARSGRARATYRLAYGADGDGQGSFSADILVGAPVMRAFARTGALNFAAVVGSEVEGRATGPGEVGAVAGFLRRCRR